jgi:hypothetical protein
MKLLPTGGCRVSNIMDKEELNNKNSNVETRKPAKAMTPARGTTTRNDDDPTTKKKRVIIGDTKTTRAATASSSNGKTDVKHHNNNKYTMTPMPLTFSPGPFDVICAKGKLAKNHPGNVRLRDLIDQFSTKYATVASRSQKSAVVDQIIGTIRNSQGAFVKKKKKQKSSNNNDDGDDGRWYEVGNHLAREKVGQSLRERNHGMYKSSTKSKRKLQRELNQKAVDQMETVVSTNDSVAAGVNQLSNCTTTVVEKKKKKTKKRSRQQKEEEEEVAATASSSVASSSSSVDSELEIAMTKANSQILASLKTDETILRQVHNGDDDDDDDDSDRSPPKPDDGYQSRKPDEDDSGASSSSSDDDDGEGNDESDAEMELALTQANSNLLATLKMDQSVRSILQEKI